MNIIESLLNRFLKHKVIVNCDHNPYLYRWYVFQTKHIALFVHKFVLSDEDRALHDHPWNFLVIPIWRGYVEHSDRIKIFDNDYPGSFFKKIPVSYPVVRRVYPIISSRYRKGEYRHRVQLIDGKPSWSLFFRFTNRRTWGFWPKEGFTAWNKWWQDKCE